MKLALFLLKRLLGLVVLIVIVNQIAMSKSLGRQTLMMPIEWTKDGWFRVSEEVHTGQRLKRPFGQNINDRFALPDDFSGNALGLQWQFFKDFDSSRFRVKNGSLYLKRRSNTLSESSPILCIPEDRSYQVEVEVIVPENSTGGITLFYNETGNVGVAVDSKGFYVIRNRKKMQVAKNVFGPRMFLRAKNIENEVTFYHSVDNEKWIRLDKSVEVSGFNHNTFGDFLSLRTGLFALGQGGVRFDHFIYAKM